jgi:hypothetical protein
LCLRSFYNLFSARGNTFARMCLLARSGPQLRGNRKWKREMGKGKRKRIGQKGERGNRKQKRKMRKGKSERKGRLMGRKK